MHVHVHVYAVNRRVTCARCCAQALYLAPRGAVMGEAVGNNIAQPLKHAVGTHVLLVELRIAVACRQKAAVGVGV